MFYKAYPNINQFIKVQKKTNILNEGNYIDDKMFQYDENKLSRTS